MFWIKYFEDNNEENMKIYLNKIWENDFEWFQKEFRMTKVFQIIDLEYRFEFNNLISYLKNKFSYNDENDFNLKMFEDKIFQTEIINFFIFLINYWDKLITIELLTTNKWKENEYKKYSIKNEKSEFVTFLKENHKQIYKKILKMHNLRNYYTHNFYNWNFVNINIQELKSIFKYRKWAKKNFELIDYKIISEAILLTLYLFNKIFNFLIDNNFIKGFNI